MLPGMLDAVALRCDESVARLKAAGSTDVANYDWLTVETVAFLESQPSIAAGVYLLGS